MFFNLVMKYKNDLIGKKVLIICNSIGISYKRLYCSYILGKIIEYNPVTNNIMLIRNIGHIGSAVEFKLNNYDPFDYPYYFDKRFATRESENDTELCWYIVLADDEAIQLLKRNLLKQNNKRPVYKSYYLSNTCYGKHKSKKEYLTYLLNELKNESN